MKYNIYVYLLSELEEAVFFFFSNSLPLSGILMMIYNFILKLPEKKRRLIREEQWVKAQLVECQIKYEVNSMPMPQGWPSALYL